MHGRYSADPVCIVWCTGGKHAQAAARSWCVGGSYGKVWACAAGDDPVRLVGMLIPEKALQDLLAELQGGEQGEPSEQVSDAAPAGHAREGPARGSLRDIR